jgi:nucleoside-diphosphate-sugar epimerase
MKILVTGHDGYIGTLLTPFMQAAGHEVVGLDIGLFKDCAYGEVPFVETLDVADVRDVRAEHLEGFDAVIHLAAISNDPVGDLNADVTYAINHRGSVSLATEAKKAGVPRFVLSSSCSSYGAADGDVALDEQADFNPVTPYGESKVLAERDIRPLADESFTPVFLRNATAYGLSPRLRGDLVVHSLLATAHTIGEVRMESDGRSWRPFCHIEDISRACLAALEAPREAVHNEAFNIGRDEDNLQIRDLALMVQATVPGSTSRSRTAPARTSARIASPSPRWQLSFRGSTAVDRAEGHRRGLCGLQGPRPHARRLPVVALPAHQAGARAQGCRAPGQRPPLAREACPPAHSPSSTMASKDTPAEDIPVVILAGGMGTRMREATESLPKPMVDIGGKPILWHIMKLYSHYGHRRFIICLGYKGWQIKEYFLRYREHLSDLTVEVGDSHGVTIHNKPAEENWR